MIRTTMNIDTKLLGILEKAADALNLKMNDLISLLLTRIIRKNYFEPRPYKRVRYQERGKGVVVWKKKHITLDAVFYEKNLDLRRNFKFSVSWFIAFAIRNYLDELVDELSNPGDPEKNQDNYTRNFVYITRMLDDVPLFISILGCPDKKYLEILLME